MCAAVLISASLLGWMILRLIKYQLDPALAVSSLFWYGYYIFQLALPAAILWLSLSAYQPEDGAAIPKGLKAVFITNGALAALTVTNNLHNWVFIVDFSNPHWASEYAYGFAFCLIQAGCWLPLIAGVFVMLYKGRGSLRKKGVFFPAALLCLLAAYAAAYVLRLPLAWESDYTMVTGFFSLLFFESALRSGMIPANTKYTALFTHSSLGMLIADERGKTLASKAAASYGAGTLNTARSSYPQPVRGGEGTLLFAAPIAGGHVFWQEDISAINRLREALSESARKLKATNILLAEEEKVKRITQSEHEKTQLLTRLEREISGHIIRLGAMIEQLPNITDQKRAMARITLLLCYIKRRCNLFFFAREKKAFESNELAVYMDELAEIAGHSGTQAVVSAQPGLRVPIRAVTLFYDLFYSVIYWATWLSGSRILVQLSRAGGRCSLRLLPSEDARSFRIDKSLYAAVSAAGGLYTVKALDDDMAGIDLSFPEGGEADG